MRALLHTIRSIWPVFVIVCLVTSCGSFAGVWYLGRKPPVTAASVAEVDGVAIRGGSIDLLISDVVRTRDCDVRVDRFMSRETDMVDKRGAKIWLWVPLAPAQLPPVPINTPTTYILSLPLPANVDPGQWLYYSRARDLCGAVPALDVPGRMAKPTPVEVLPGSRGTATPSFELLLPEHKQPPIEE